MMSRWSTILLAAGLFMLSLSVSAAATGPQQLEHFLQGLKTLSARFQQTVASGPRQARVEAAGRLYLQRPGLFRWEYDEPQQLIVADGRRIWLYDKELEQISHKDQQDALAGTPALLLSGTRPLQEDFEVNDLGHRGGYDWAELRPKSPDSEFRRILMAFSDDQLYRMDVDDNFGQTTGFRFSRVRRNPTLDPGLFHFEPPSGVDLFDQ